MVNPIPFLSAGSVMAGRLSEHLDRTVLLIEAGGADNEYADIPFIFEEFLDTPFVAPHNPVDKAESVMELVMLNKDNKQF